MNPRIVGLISGQGTCLGDGPGPHLGAYERQPTDVSLACWRFFPSLSPCLSLFLKINKILKKIKTEGEMALYRKAQKYSQCVIPFKKKNREKSL